MTQENKEQKHTDKQVRALNKLLAILLTKLIKVVDKMDKELDK